MKHRNVFADGKVDPECQWVLDGLGVAVALYDSRSHLNTGTDWYVRHDLGPDDAPPAGFEPGQHATDGGMAGWAPADDDTLPDPAELPPGPYERLGDGTLVHHADAEVLARPTKRGRSAKQVRTLAAQACERGFAGVLFRSEEGTAKVRQ